MAELLISSQRTRQDELRTLIDHLDDAIPGVEPIEDKERVFMLTLSTSALAYEAREPSPDESEGVEVSLGILDVADIVSLVLPAVAGVTVKAALDVTVDWLRGLREKPVKGEKAVLIYGPRGEPLHKVRLRAGETDPEVFAPPWPRRLR